MRVSKVVAPAVSLILFIGLWYLLSVVVDIPAYYLPLPHSILAALWEQRSVLLSATGITILYSVSGFLLALVVGLGLALIMGTSRLLRESLYPWVLLLQMTPVIILAPIFVLWLDYGPASVVVMTFLTSFFPIVASATHGLIATKRELVECFRVFRSTRLQELMWLRLPYAIPQIMVGVRIAATLVTISAIFAEFFVGSFQDGRGGLGLMVFIYNKELRISELFAAGLMANLLGIMIVFAVSRINTWIVKPWHDSFKSTNQQ